MSDLSPQNTSGRVREVLARGLPKAFRGQEYSSLKPAIEEARAGNFTNFDKRPIKEQQFALLAILIESWWSKEVTEYCREHVSVQGLSFRGKPVPEKDFQLLSDTNRPLINRRRVASDCMLETLSITANRFVSRLLSPDGDVKLGTRYAYASYRDILNREIPGTGALPGVLHGILQSGWDNAVAAVWMLPEAICKQVVSGVALSHGGAFGFFRAAINNLGSNGEDFSQEQLLASMRKATKDRGHQDASLELFRQVKELGNSSYHPQTVGCPAFYTSAFNGLIEWVSALKQVIK